MQLPNPFASTSVKPENSLYTNTVNPNNNKINPGPGLPQARSVDYSSYAINAQSDQRQQKARNYGQFNNNRSFNQQYLPFSCDRCDRSFKSQELLDAHIAEHVQCGIDGCKFVAHPKIVEKHIQMQHETGLALRIMKLTSPEEIAKWREERKRNFPSASNVAQKMEAQKERIERGEILNTSDRKFSKRTHNQRGRGRGASRGGFGKTRNAENQTKVAPSVPAKETITTPKVTLVKTEKVLSEGEIDSEDDKETTDTVGVKVEPTGNALANLMDMYASDSDQEDIPAKKPALTENAIPTMSEPKASEGKPPAPAKEKVERGSTRRPKNRGVGKSPGNKNSKNTQGKANLVRPKRLTLLQKLLQSEIVHERNIILQCVHYIVQQNFFGIGQPKAAP